MDDAQARLARAWDEAAAGYEQYFVPRFAPWVDVAVDAVAGELPPGPILVPCCGTLPELPALQAAQPGREIVGIDLSAGMVDIARARAADAPQVDVVQGDAAKLEPWSEACAAVVSVFGLQQLPEPATALANWVRALRPGGRLSVMFWPPDGEQSGPFALLSGIFEPPGPKAEPTWPARLHAAVEQAGGKLEADDDVRFPMSHPDAETFWTAMTTGGPGRAFARTKSPEFLRAVRAEFLAQAPAGEWTHRPRARHIVAGRPAP